MARKKRQFFNLSPTGTVSAQPRDNITISGNPITGTGGASIQTGEVKYSVSGNPATGTVAPTVQIGEGQGASLGAQGGGAVGSIFGPVGSGVGSAVGSAIGNQIDNLTGGNSQAQKETKDRKSVYGNLNHLWDGGKFTFPDGSTFDYNSDGEHAWKNPSKRVNGVDRNLFSYETDYTNDLDYLSGMAGITLSRLLNGGSNKAIDQAGNLLGNSFLGKTGYGADFNQDNFNSVMTNARSHFGKAGIQNKEEMLGLINKAYADKRINDTDHVAMQQAAALVFDNDFGKAAHLVSGRWQGLGTAGKTPTGSSSEGSRQNRPGRIYSPVISPEEAMLSVQPLVDIYLKNRAQGKGQQLDTAKQEQAKLAQGLAIASGIYKIGDKLTGGALSETMSDAKNWAVEGIRGVGQDIMESLGLTTNTGTAEAYSGISDVVNDLGGTASDVPALADATGFGQMDIGQQYSGF